MRGHLEWVADRVLEAGGTALLLRAQAFTGRHEQTVARGMAAARVAGYEHVRREADEADLDDGMRRLRRLRKELRGIQRRDHFPPVERDRATTAVSAPVVRWATRAGIHIDRASSAWLLRRFFDGLHEYYRRSLVLGTDTPA